MLAHSGPARSALRSRIERVCAVAELILHHRTEQRPRGNLPVEMASGADGWEPQRGRVTVIIAHRERNSFPDYPVDDATH